MPTPLNIKDPEAYQLASEISRSTGKSLTRVVVDALRQEHARSCPRQVDRDRARAILKKVHRWKIVDHRPADEMLGYSGTGTFD